MIVVTSPGGGPPLRTGQVAALLRMSRRHVLRIPRDRLDYWTTPGGPARSGDRRFLRDDVTAYAREYLGLDIQLG